MNTPSPTPARLRLLVQGADLLPTITPALAALTEQMADVGLTPDQLHPVIALMLRHVTLTAASSHGWTLDLASELASEQAEELRRHGLAYQLDFLFHALGGDPVAMALCLYGVHCGETEAVLQQLANYGSELNTPRGAPTPWRRASRRRPVS